MRNRSFLALVAAFVLAAFFLESCAVASHNAPKGWLPKAEGAPQDVYGGWIEVSFYVHNAKERTTENLSGELIALGKDSLFVAADTLRAVARGTIASALVAGYDVREEVQKLTFYKLMGTLVSLSHGWAFFFTGFSMWLVIESSFIASYSYGAAADYDDDVAWNDWSAERWRDYANAQWRSLKPYARFPQGLPPNLNRKEIKARP